MSQRLTEATKPRSAIYSAIDTAIPYAAGGLVLYAFLGNRKAELLETMFWGGIAVQVYDRVQEARRRGNYPR